MMIKLVVLGFWLAVSPAPALSADLYQWTDAAGVIHFSDNPQAVPREVRNSGLLKTRKDFFPTMSIRANPPEQAPVDRSLSHSSDAVTPILVGANSQPPMQVIYAPQENTIVVVNQQPRSARHLQCRRERCAPAFHPNSNDRQYIHPGVFSGGSRQYVRP